MNLVLDACRFLDTRAPSVTESSAKEPTQRDRVIAAKVERFAYDRVFVRAADLRPNGHRLGFPIDRMAPICELGPSEMLYLRVRPNVPKYQST